MMPARPEPPALALCPSAFRTLGFQQGSKHTGEGIIQFASNLRCCLAVR